MKRQSCLYQKLDGLRYTQTDMFLTRAEYIPIDLHQELGGENIGT